ncbi:MAG: anti-sigma factor [Gemmatimonadales bacterium]
MNTPGHHYTCEDVFRRLDDYLDRELSAEEMRLVREHLDACAQCASEHRFESRVLADVREKLTRIRAPEGLITRVRNAIHDDQGGNQDHQRGV